VVALELAHQLAEAGEPVNPLCFIDVTPEDFPGLVPNRVRRRFRTHRWSVKIRDELPRIRSRKLWKRGPYVVREMGRALLNHTRARRMRSRLARGEIQPGSEWDVSGVSREAFALHRSRAWPGRIILFLREQDRHRYGSNPADVWRELALGGCELHYLSGSPLDFHQPGQTEEVAELLRAVLERSS
jgi:thioesterase domain-containing protein